MVAVPTKPEPPVTRTFMVLMRRESEGGRLEQSKTLGDLYFICRGLPRWLLGW